MSEIYLYCDESCHLPNDKCSVMVLGALACPKEHARDVSESLREARIRHGLSTHLEIKWGGVSPAKVDFFKDVLTIFLDDPKLQFRAVIASKENLRHAQFQQTHDDWYHKIYFQLLKHLVTGHGDDRFRIFLDIKDSKSSEKVRRLHEILCNQVYDFSREILQTVQVVRSHEVAHIQLADLLTGAVSYSARELASSQAKQSLIELLENRIGRSIDSTSRVSERKFNIFKWYPK